MVVLPAIDVSDRSLFGESQSTQQRLPNRRGALTLVCDLQQAFVSRGKIRSDKQSVRAECPTTLDANCHRGIL